MSIRTSEIEYDDYARIYKNISIKFRIQNFGFLGLAYVEQPGGMYGGVAPWCDVWKGSTLVGCMEGLHPGGVYGGVLLIWGIYGWLCASARCIQL